MRECGHRYNILYAAHASSLTDVYCVVGGSGSDRHSRPVSDSTPSSDDSTPSLPKYG